MPQPKPITANERALGRILAGFIEIFCVSGAHAARVLGVSVASLRAFLNGRYPGSALPSRVSDATLSNLVRNMNAHAEAKGHPWRTSFEDLRDARDEDHARDRADLGKQAV